MKKYILKDGEPVLCDDTVEWGRWWETDDRTVQKDTFGDVRVSTVFLGLDRCWDGGPPVLWETMIFGGEHDGFEKRYTSKADAECGHLNAVALVHRVVASSQSG